MTVSVTREWITDRELQVLKLAAEGFTNSEIGEQLSLSPLTIQTYVQRILRILEARSRAHAVAIAFRTGLLS